MIVGVAGIALSTSVFGVSTPVRLIVRLTQGAVKSALTPKARIAKLATDTGVSLTHVRSMALGADVVTVDGSAAAEEVAARLAADPDVDYAVVDHRVHAMQAGRAAVNDTYAQEQHYLANSSTGISAYDAWTVTQGSPNIVVAVIDTGYRPHAAMVGRFLPGYDMISDPETANDGDGRDPDALDPGDWVTAAEAHGDCSAQNSTWHGTSVAGIIAANTNDAAWTAGIDWNAKILPVRVLGKCGGFDSDVVDAIAWAAGLAVPGVLPNPTPAQVINLSLGSPNRCEQPFTEVAAAAYAAGVTRAIVAAAGNDSHDVSNDSPAGCPGYYAIASTTDVGGSLASFSNFGAGITLSAPGGAAKLRAAADTMVVLGNSGTTVPVADVVVNEGGTSFSAPMVSATVSLMLSVAPYLTVDQVHDLIVSTVKPFPPYSDCTTDRCGAGILDAGAAVRAAAAVPPPPAAVNYQGLWWASPAGSESGWGINLAHQGDIIFATWFTYDTTGKAWWLSMTASRTGPNSYAGDLLTTRGPAFSATPFDPNAVTHATVGHATLAFTDANTAQFSYTVNGVAQVKTLTRELFGTAPACAFGGQPNLAAATNYQDLWWASPAGIESGWGINLTEQSNEIFGTWFTYDVDGSPLWLSVLATNTAPGVYQGPLMRTRGPAFDAVPFAPSAVTATPVGTATFTFQDGAHATFAYTVNGVSQAKAITREVFVNPGTYCQ
jgi:serine protease